MRYMNIVQVYPGVRSLRMIKSYELSSDSLLDGYKFRIQLTYSGTLGCPDETIEDRHLFLRNRCTGRWSVIADDTLPNGNICSHNHLADGIRVRS